MGYVPDRKINLPQFRAISHAISTYEDIHLLGRNICESICRTFGIKAASVLVFDDREKELYYVCSEGLSDEYLQDKPAYIEGKYEEFTKGKPVFFQNLQNDERVEYPEAAKKEGVVSMLSFPIKYRTDVVGLLKLYNSEEWMIHSDDQDSITILSEQFGLVIENNGLKNFLDEVRAVMGNLPLRMCRGF